MKVGLINSVVLNGGDAGIVYGTCDAIASSVPSAQISVFAHQAHAAARYYPDLNLLPMVFDTWPRSRGVRAAMRRTYALRQSLGLRSRGERTFLADIGSCDAIVYCGGGYLNDSYDMRLLLSMIDLSLGTGVPHMAYAHSVGPITRPHSIKNLRRLLNRFDLVTVRDEASLTLLQDLGVKPDRLELLADAALAMRTEQGDTLSEADRTALQSIQHFKQSRAMPLVFMSVRSWKFPGHADAVALERNLREQLTRLAREILTRTNWSICFVSTCQGRAEYAYDDSAVAHQLVAELGDTRSRVMVSSHGFAPRTYPYLIRTCADLVISMRMHLTIFSLLGGVPFVAIAYERKSAELCRRLDIEQFCHDAAGFDASSGIAAALQLHAQRASLTEKLRCKRDELVALSSRNASLFAERCLGVPVSTP